MGRKPKHEMDKPSGYDKTLELLATLPAVEIKKCVPSTPMDDRPMGARIRDLMAMFGHTSESPIRKLITDTQVRHKVILVTYATPEGCCVGVAKQHAAKAEMLASAYWDRVYGGSGAA